MRRQVIDGGQWFDLDKAKCFDESSWFDGSNHISHATGSQWEHEALYRTRGGRWILHSWSQWQGSRDEWIEIDDAAAAKWLVRNGYDPHPACEAEYAALEVQ